VVAAASSPSAPETGFEEQFSLDVGAVRFTERFGLADAVSREAIDAALAAIAADLTPLEGRPRPDMVIAIGETSANLAAVAHRLNRYGPDAVHGIVVDVSEVNRQTEMYRRRSADLRHEIAGLQPARAEVILAGACIVHTILTLAVQDAVTVSDRGLRHGVAAERFGS
jgi:exopolyphosphatase/guanosine-5'-triphosphate,3'-diphosphate pyrophosphatase